MLNDNYYVCQKASHEVMVEAGKKAYATRLRNKAERERLNGEIQEIRTEIKKEDKKVIIENVFVKKCTVAEAAEFILLKKRKPMHYNNIYKKSLKLELIKSSIKSASVFSTMSTDVHGVNPRFKHFGKGVFGLLKWGREIPKESIAAHKASDTKRMRSIIKGKNTSLVSVKKELTVWDGDNKDYWRNIIAKKYFSMFGGGNVLALESQELRFAKLLPHHDFYIWEKDLDVCKAISKNVLPNIKHLVYGDIAFADDFNYHYAFLDFCGTYDTQEKVLKNLVPLLSDTLFIALTFSGRWYRSKPKLERSGKRYIEDYKFEIIRNLENIFENHKFEICGSYRDIGKNAVAVFILKNRNLKCD